MGVSGCDRDEVSGCVREALLVDSSSALAEATDETEMTPRAKIRLNLTDFEVDPDEVSRLLGISPDFVCRKGEAILETLRSYPENGWRLVSSLSASSSVEEHVLNVLDRIEPVAHLLPRLERLEVEVSCVVYYYDYTPVLGLSREVIRRLARLGASLDYDLYDMGSDEGSDDLTQESSSDMDYE